MTRPLHERALYARDVAETADSDTADAAAQAAWDAWADEAQRLGICVYCEAEAIDGYTYCRECA